MTAIAQLNQYLMIHQYKVKSDDSTPFILFLCKIRLETM